MKKLKKESLQQQNKKLEKELEKKSASLKRMKRSVEIEASLERMRVVAINMRKSEDLVKVCESIYRELISLGFSNIHNAQIAIRSEVKGFYLLTEYSDFHVAFMQKAPYKSSPLVKELFNKLEKSSDAWYLKKFKGKEFEKYRAWRSGIAGLADSRLEKANSLNFYLFSMGSKQLGISTFKEITKEQLGILKRFKNVFELSYRRYMDVMLAEAQAREAQIEAALERVRARAMAMQKSEDLGNAIEIVFEELDKLNLDIIRCGIGILNKEKPSADVWATTKSDRNQVVQISGDESMEIHPLLRGAYDAWLKQKDFDYILKGTNLNDYYKALTGVNFRLPESQSLVSGNEEMAQYYFNTIFPAGGLFAFSETAFSDEAKNIMRRFAHVFDLTYTRFLDLQKAEAQTREAQIETALERVRSRTLAMQKSDELAETAAELFRQLIGLGVEPNRLFIIIVKEDTGDLECWVTDEDGSILSNRFTANIKWNPSMREMYEGWKEQKKSIIIDMQGTELSEFIRYLSDELKVPFRQGLTQKRRVQHIAYFAKGFIGMASPGPQPVGTIDLLERFAGVFNLTYTRFNDLKLAEYQADQAHLDLIRLQTEKKRAEEALKELKSAQALLIQSEKMASLGELTAGIAHEIQNPLNFVNNFSEVSNELMDEMNAEIEKGEMNEARTIAADIKQNLEKITYHGKRADAIVKSMLQHSTNSSGIKEPTNINALADEYLRLAYHGLRAKDISFNASMKADYDETIGCIDIISQDMGRVILNLITNAFYAVTEKRKLGTGGYEPTVTVSTKKIDGRIEIRVSDNGNGIPPKVLDKIFQPFFTTKPTGQGTGLGLSLSYDIVKAHGGDLKVESTEGEGAAFVVQIPAG